MSISIEEAKALVDVPALWRHFGFEGEPRKSCRCPFHDDRSASFSVSPDGQLWHCFAGCGGGDSVTFVERAARLSQGDACRTLVEIASHSAVPASPIPRRCKTPKAPVPLPAMREGDARQLRALADLRHVSAEAVNLASQRGLVRFGEWRGRLAWFVCDRSRRVAQARRLDGELWWPDGPKAQTLPGGSAAWPVGLPESEGFALMALCEGGPDLLAAFHFAWCEDREGDVAPVAMLGASQRIHADALPRFRGRRVRIFRHCDPAGHKAAREWTRQLRDTGATVDAFDLSGLSAVDGSPAKDLNDLTQLDADAFEQDRNLWNIFDHEQQNH